MQINDLLSFNFEINYITFKDKGIGGKLSAIGLVTMYLIIQLVVFFSILPIDVNRKRKFLIPANEVGAPEDPKILKKTFYSIGITTIIFIIICLLMRNDFFDLRNIIS